MTGAVLADTGPLYALADPSDQFHKRAQSELAAMDAKRLRVIVNYPVLCESHTLVLRRLGGAYSRQWLAEVLEGSSPLNPEPGDYAAAAVLLDRFPDHPITLVDAVLAALSRRVELPIWSFDRHFGLMRTKLWR